MSTQPSFDDGLDRLEGLVQQLESGALSLEEALLRFEGVESCFAVWLNGVRLGDAKGSRLPHEFDVTAHVKPGANVLAGTATPAGSGSTIVLASDDEVRAGQPRHQFLRTHRGRDA